ncbi:hypothetical protein FZC66_06415 [Priestia megaterium]|nr:hypothetical protein FZC66_06415 [Priestia megaterium]
MSALILGFTALVLSVLLFFSNRKEKTSNRMQELISEECASVIADERNLNRNSTKQEEQFQEFMYYI